MNLEGKQMSDMTKKYVGFNLLNMKTQEVKSYPYVKGIDSITVEDRAIREQAEITGLAKSNFTVYGLIKRF